MILQLKTLKQVSWLLLSLWKVFGDIINNSRSANPGKLLSKPNTRPNPKKKKLLLKHCADSARTFQQCQRETDSQTKNYQGITQNWIKWWPPFYRRDLLLVYHWQKSADGLLMVFEATSQCLVFTPWVDIIAGRITKGDCALSMTDSTTSEGWLRKSNFIEDGEDDLAAFFVDWCFASSFFAAFFWIVGKAKTMDGTSDQAYITNFQSKLMILSKPL